MLNLTMPQAVLLGAAIVGGAILMTSPAAPARYQFLATETNMVWRLDGREGSGTLCTLGRDPTKHSYLDCSHQFGVNNR
jgi:hypothetical protein